MPDFAAIHSKQISKMESIADNLARKQERALYLTTPDGVKTTPSDMNKGESKYILPNVSFILKVYFSIDFSQKEEARIQL